MRQRKFHVKKLTTYRSEVLQRGYSVESSSASKCVATFGGDNDQQPVCDGIELDGQREYQ